MSNKIFLKSNGLSRIGENALPDRPSTITALGFISLSMLRPTRLAVAIRTLIAGGIAISSGVPQVHAELPVPTHPISLSHTPVDIATLGHATAAVSGNAMTIKQITDKTSLDWQSFNIGSQNSVRFDQPTSTSVALNNIHQSDPSKIMGSLTANGQVYLVNQNGFVFGPNSQVNVNSLVATTLGISDSVFQNGITRAFEDKGGAAFQGNSETFIKDKQGHFVLDQHGEKIKIQIFIESGAKIKTNAPGGRVIIAAPVVNNAGTIETPDGQTILAAAKDKVYLQEAGSDSNIRGLLVEVGTGGAINNVGKVLAERGNVSLLGFAVNQQGIASATTSVNLNGSVRLLAREGIQEWTKPGDKLLPKSTIRPTDLGDGLGTKAAVHLASGSLTTVALDADKSVTAIDAQGQTRSHIEISGHDVYLHNKSTVQAKSGKIDIAAIDNPTDTTEKGDARVFLESGSLIDASGVKNVQVAMDKNIVEVEIRNNELRDSPLQRVGILHGQKVLVDLRYATLKYDANGKLVSAKIPIADIKGAVDKIARNIDERSTSGGTINLKSTGDVITQSGSVIDFSGGSVAYQDGFIETTKLVSNGHIYDISTADPNRHYDSILGLITDNHPKWGFTDTWTIPGLGAKHFESGFIAGKAGGILDVVAYETRLNGILDGSTVAGTFQRTTGLRAPGSSLAIDLNNNNPFGKQDVVFNKSEKLIDIGFNEKLPRKTDGTNDVSALSLNSGLFKRSGITNVSISTNGSISLQKDARLDLPVDGSLKLSATNFDIQGSIIAPSGEINLSPVTINNTQTPSGITLGSSAVIDVAGLWVNDFLDGKLGHPLKPIAIDGGSVSLVTEQADLRLEKGSRIDVSGGAKLDNKTQVTPGKSGNINLVAASHDAGGKSSSLIMKGKLEGWGIAQGGSLNLNTNEIVIGSAKDAPIHAGATTMPLILSPDFFQQGGFGNYSLTSNLHGLKVAENAQIKVQQKNRELDDSVATQSSGTDIKTFSTPVTLPNTERNPANLTLSFAESIDQNRAESLNIGKGALIQTDAKGSVELDSDTSIFVDGSINTPGGNISININTPGDGSKDNGFYSSQGIWLGSSSRLLAKGIFKPELNDFGLKTGAVLSGGNIELTTKRGYIVARRGSLLDVSGTSENLDFQQPFQVGSARKVESKNIASEGGKIGLSAGEGMLFDGTLKAEGGKRAAGGSLTVELNPKLRNKHSPSVPGGLFPDDVNKTLPRTIVISENSEASIPKNLAQGGGIASNKYSGRAFLNAKQLNQANFDSLNFKTDVLSANGKYGGSVQFNGNVDLNATRQITLDTPTLQTSGGKVNLNASYVALGSTQSRVDKDLGEGKFATTLAPTAKTGHGKLSVNAKGIDLIGGLSFDGFNKFNLLSQGDVRTVGIRIKSDTKDFLGELKLAGDLTIKANQVYPATLTDYKISVNGKGNETVTFLKNGNTLSPVYSAGGNLTVNAPNIVQKGVVKAPFGTLTLDANKKLTLAAGSLTSVSGNGLTIPFGQGSGGVKLAVSSR